MGLLNPALFAAAAACVAVPILIHLLMRRRRRPIEWAAMRFLIEAYKKNRKRLLIERWLLLALRCLALLLLAVVLGRPALDAAGLDGPGSRTVYILLDDSLTSTAQDASGVSGLDRSTERAIEVVQGLDPLRGDRVALISMSTPARGLVLGPSTNLDAVSRLIESAQSTDAAADLPGALALVSEDLASGADADDGVEAQAGPVVVAMFSDWLDGTSGSSPAAWPSADSAVEFLISPPLAESPQSVRLMGVSPVRGVTSGDDVGGDRVRLSLQRDGRDRATSRVLLRALTGEAGLQSGSLNSWSPPIGEAVVRWEAGQTTAEAVAAFDPASLSPASAGGWAALRAEVDADALPGDDVRYAVIQRRPTLRVGVASSLGPAVAGAPGAYHPAQWVTLALAPGSSGEAAFDAAEDAGLQLRDLPTTGIESERLSDLAAIVLVEPARVSVAGWSRLGDFVARGGLLLVFPDADETAAPVWPAQLEDAAGLDWTIGAVRALDPEAMIDAGSAGPLLRLIEPELEDLAGSVPVRRVLMASGERAELSLNDGSPLVLAQRGSAGRGQVLLFAAALDLDWTDLPARGLMVPLMQELLRQGIDAASPRAVSIAGETPAAPFGTVELTATGRERVAVGMGDAARFAGVWLAADAQGQPTGLAVVNPNAAAGEAGARSVEDVRSWLASQVGREPSVLGEDASKGDADAAGVRRTDAGWALPAAMALLVALLIEAGLARRFSHADGVGSTPPIGPGRGGRR